MVDLRHDEYWKAIKLGFKPKNNVKTSVHKKHYFITDSDYYNFLRIMENNTKESHRQ